MCAIAIGALWLGGLVFQVLCVAVAGLVLLEWWRLVERFAMTTGAKARWIIAGLIYVAVASLFLADLRRSQGFEGTLTVLSMIWATDIGAYIVGRSVGGRKIAPAISPSKTWAGLFGGMGAAGAVGIFAASQTLTSVPMEMLIGGAIAGFAIAIVAQAGDFFQSWMKRRADVKDSGTLLPGHGGVFDRVDGLIAVMFVCAALKGTMLLVGVGRA